MKTVKIKIKDVLDYPYSNEEKKKYYINYIQGSLTFEFALSNYNQHRFRRTYAFKEEGEVTDQLGHWNDKFAIALNEGPLYLISDKDRFKCFAVPSNDLEGSVWVYLVNSDGSLDPIQED